MAKAQEDLAQRFADVASRASDSSSRVLARQILALLPRGGGNAEEIPGGLAHTMRTNNIREGHSNHNGIEDRFLEEWKRKLEGSTTQEDVAICEAYLHFLHSGDWNQFYQYIWDNHRISRDRLESMDRPIRSPAVHLPQLIPAMKHFLWVLKITHSGITLDESVEFAKVRESRGDDDTRRSPLPQPPRRHLSSCRASHEERSAVFSASSLTGILSSPPRTGVPG